jgi:ATP synthase protein I
LTSPTNPSRPVSQYREPKGRAFALQIVAAQVVVSCLGSLVGLAFSIQVAIVILLGGMICSLANLWLAIVAFRPALGKSPGEMLAAFYVGEIGKFVVTALLFLIVFTQFSLFKQPIYALLIFIAYALVQSMVWVYPLARSRLFKHKSAR